MGHPAEVNPAPGSIKVSSDVDSLSSSEVGRQLYTLRCQQCWVVVPKGQSCPDHPDAPLIDRTFKSYSDMFPAKVHESKFGGGGWSVVIFFLEILGLLLKFYLCYYFFRNGYCPCCPRSDTPPGAEDHHDPPAGEYVEKEIDMSQYNTSPNVDDIEAQIEKHELR